jgi:hypothetical protein
MYASITGLRARDHSVVRLWHNKSFCADVQNEMTWNAKRSVVNETCRRFRTRDVGKTCEQSRLTDLRLSPVTRHSVDVIISLDLVSFPAQNVTTMILFETQWFTVISVQCKVDDVVGVSGRRTAYRITHSYRIAKQMFIIIIIVIYYYFVLCWELTTLERRRVVTAFALFGGHGENTDGRPRAHDWYW